MSRQTPRLVTVFEPAPLLGRSIVVSPGMQPPAAWADRPRRVIDQQTLDDPSLLASTIAELHRCWVRREPVVLELGVPDAALRAVEATDEAPWRLGAEFTFPLERLLHLTWVNSYDARSGTPIWWWSRKAGRVGASAGIETDIILPDGTPAWVDGGPRGDRTDLKDPVVSWETVAAGDVRPEPPRAPIDHAALAEDQLRAVTHGGGPARVVAPAGAGKTRTLHARLRELIRGRGIPVDGVVAVAYNNRAADELRSRVEPGLRSAVRTIHSLGRRVLFSSVGELRILDEREVRGRLEPLVPVARRPNTDIVGPYVEALADVRVGLRSPEAVEASRDDVPELSRVMDEYRARLRATGSCDFDELIYGAIQALMSDPDLRARWQWSCRHLLVDEFQDLTPGYLLLLRLLASPTLDVFGVGDDDQVIYGYAGADPRFLIEYDHIFPGAESFSLETNYRCPVPIVESAGRLLSYNHRRVEKSTVARANAPASGLEVVRESGDRGAIVTADLIENRLERGAAASDIVVLCRVNSALLSVHAALADRRIGMRSPLDRATLSRTVMAAALAWLRLATSERLRRTDLMLAVRRPSRGLTRLAGRLLGRHSSVELADLRELGRSLEGRRADRWDGWCADIAAVRRVAASGDVRTVVEGLVSTVGLGRAAAALDAGRTRADRAAQSDDLVALQRLAALHPRLDDFETWLRDRLAVPPVDDGVLLTTIHRVKGLEWPSVLVFGADRGLLPHALAEDIEEERRIFHVALTRGQDEVVVVADAERPSRFLAEMEGSAPRVAPAPDGDRAVAGDGVAVAVGDEVRVVGGFGGVVERRIPTGVLLRLDGGTGRLAVTWGETITTRAGSGPLRPGTVEPDAALVERLKAWRLQTAAAGGVPAYIVLTDASIDELAARRPRSEQELLNVRGIGPAKLEAYGDELLDLCGE